MQENIKRLDSILRQITALVEHQDEIIQEMKKDVDIDYSKIDINMSDVMGGK